MVAGYESLIEHFALPDPTDRHVVAAAVAGEAEVILTLNLKDFPADRLPAGIVALAPDQFLTQQFDRDGRFLDSWGEALTQSVLGNVGALVAFRPSGNDSRHLGHAFRPFTPEHLEDLDRFEAVVKLQVDGRTAPAFDIRTQEPRLQPSGLPDCAISWR